MFKLFFENTIKSNLVRVKKCGQGAKSLFIARKKINKRGCSFIMYVFTYLSKYVRLLNVYKNLFFKQIVNKNNVVFADSISIIALLGIP